MGIWFQKVTLEQVNRMSENTMLEQLGIEFTEIGEDYLKAVMPVDHRTRQPMGLLHGGASVALAETLGSVGSYLTLNPAEYYCVTLEINANHLRAVREGTVTGTGRPIHLGRSTQIWEIRITDHNNKLVSLGRMTQAIVDASKMLKE